MHQRRVYISGLLALLFCFTFNSLAAGVADTLEQKVQSAIDQNRVVNDLGYAFHSHPSGEFLLAPKNGDLRFGIIIYNIDILPEKAIFSAGIAFRDPRNNQLVAFNADQIIFSHTYGITGPVKLHLLDSFCFQMGKVVQLTFLGGNSNLTYATFDCAGLREFSISGLAKFQTNTIQAVNDTGEVIPNLPLTTQFQITTQHWHQILAEVSIPPFQVRSTPGYIFRINRAVLDLSETQNSMNVLFPKVYYSQNLLGGNVQIWEGFYLEKGTLTLPRFFKTENGIPLQIGVERLLIDEFGFSGNIFVEHVLDFEKGTLAGWNFSIEQFKLNIELNQLTGGLLSGDIGLPVLPDTSRLGYYGRFDKDAHYLFSISTKGNLTIPAWRAASLQLTKNSFVSAEIDHKNVVLSATLHGQFVMLSQSSDKVPIKIPNISFRGLHVSNKSPKFSVEYLGISKKPDSAHYSHFPLQITRLEFTGLNNQYLLQAGFLLHLTEYASAEAGIHVYCNYITKNNHDRLVFDRYGINSIAFDFEKSGIFIKGRADLFQSDLDYGNGFSGSIAFKLNQPAISAQARILFGTVQDLRYWYFDAETMWPAPGIVLFPGANINGFVGGAWHRLSPWDGQKPIAHPEYGRVASGAVLVPSKSAGLGVKAGAYINGGTSQSYQAKTVLELQFLSSGALARTLFYGDLQIMGEKTQPTTKNLSQTCGTMPSVSAWNNYVKNYAPTGQLAGPFMLEWDFLNHSFFGNSALYINHAAGNTVNGALANGLAGELTSYFSANKWYLRAGTPMRPLSAKISIDGLTAVESKVYAIGGSELLEPAPLPAEIRQVLGTSQNNLALRNGNDINSGKGFALGMQFSAEAAAGGTDKKVSVYARLRAITGFDVNIKEYPNLICGSTQQKPGFHSWYSQGRLYSFVQGKIGASVGKVAVDVMTLTGVLDMEMAAPAPTYASGKTRLVFNLGGLFKFKSDLNIALGTACMPQPKGAADSQILENTTPSIHEDSVNIFATIRAQYSVPLNETILLPDGKKIMFKQRSFLITGGKTSNIGKWVIAQDGYTGYYDKNDALTPLSNYHLHFEFEVLELKNNQWSPLMQHGKPLVEIRDIDFKTGPRPNNLPTENISYAWPYNNQVNFYPKQVSKGYIKLHFQQDYLFNMPGTKTIARFSDTKFQTIAEKDVTYANGKLTFEIPSALAGGNTYRLRIVRMPIATGSQISSASMNTNKALLAKNPGSSTGSSATSGASQPPVLLYDMWFRCSYFGTIQEKMNSFSVVRFQENSDKTIKIELNNSKNELFETREFISAQSAMNYSALLSNTPWFVSEGQRKTYSIIGIIPSSYLLSRDTSILGLFPAKSLVLSQPGIENIQLSDAQKTSNTSIDFGFNNIQIQYNVIQTVNQDLLEIANRIDQYPLASQPTVQKAILNYKTLFTSTAFTPISAGKPTIVTAGSATKLPFVVPISRISSAPPSASGPITPVPTKTTFTLLPSFKPSNYPVFILYPMPGESFPTKVYLNVLLK